MGRGFVVGLLALVIGASGCAYLRWVPFVPDEEWQTVSTARFTAHGNLDADELPTATLEALELGHALLASSLFPEQTIAPVEVLLLEWPEFRRILGGQRTQATIARLPGKPSYGKRGLLVMYTLDGSLAGASHRLTHLFLHARAPKAPVWLHEGLATWLEGAQYKAGAADPVVCLGQLPARPPELDVGKLFALSWAAFDDDPAASGYRYLAANVIDYLMMAESGRLREKVGELIDALAEGAETVPALVKVYPELRPSVLAERMREHRRQSQLAARGVCPIPYPVPADKVAARGAPKLAPIVEEDLERLDLQLRLLPRRGGYVDWYPPEMIGLEGGQVRRPVVIP